MIIVAIVFLIINYGSNNNALHNFDASHYTYLHVSYLLLSLYIPYLKLASLPNITTNGYIMFIILHLIKTFWHFDRIDTSSLSIEIEKCALLYNYIYCIAFHLHLKVTVIIIITSLTKCDCIHENCQSKDCIKMFSI